MNIEYMNNDHQENIEKRIIYKKNEYKIVINFSSENFTFNLHQIHPYIIYENIFSFKDLQGFQLFDAKKDLKEIFYLLLEKIEKHSFEIEKNDKNIKFIILHENDRIELDLLKKETNSNDLIDLLLDEVYFIKQKLSEEINKLKIELKIKDNRIENLNTRINLLEKEIFCYDQENSRFKTFNKDSGLKMLTGKEDDYNYLYQESQFINNHLSYNNLTCEIIIDKKIPVKLKSNYQGKKIPVKVNIKVKNNGIIPIPNGCILKCSKDNESDFIIMDTLFNGEQILPNQLFYATIFLFFKNINDIKEGINVFKFFLYHEKYGQIGNEGLIQIEVIDDTKNKVNE